MSGHGSYAAVMKRRDAIMRASVGIDYDRYRTGALAFDYERLLADTGYEIESARAVQAATGVGATPLLELHHLTALVRAVAVPGKGARLFLKDEAKNPSGSFTRFFIRLFKLKSTVSAKPTLLHKSDPHSPSSILPLPQPISRCIRFPPSDEIKESSQYFLKNSS